MATMQAPSERLYRPLESFFECLTRSRFDKADEHLRFFFNSLPASPFLREFHTALRTFCQSLACFRAGRFLPYVHADKKKKSLLSLLFGSATKSPPSPAASSSSVPPPAVEGVEAASATEESTTDQARQQILDVLDGVRKCKFYLEEATNSPHSNYNQFFSGLLQQLQVIAESKRVLIETYVWLYTGCAAFIDVNADAYYQHRDSLLNLATLRQAKEPQGVNPYLAWLWHDCSCEATLLLLLLQLHSAHARQSFMLSCLYLQDALKTLHHWHTGFTAHRAAAATRSRATSVAASPHRRTFESSSSLVSSSASTSSLGIARSLSTDQLLRTHVRLDDLDNYHGDRPASPDSGDDASPPSSAPPTSRFASFLSDEAPMHNISSVALPSSSSSSGGGGSGGGVGGDVTAPGGVVWDAQYFGAASPTYAFLKDWLRLMSYRTALLFSRLLVSLEGGLARGLQSNNPYSAALENMFARTQADACYLAYRRSRDSEYHSEGYRLPLAPAVAAQEFASPFSVAVAAKAKREAFDGLRSYPCIFAVPGPHEPRKDQWANVVSLIMQEDAVPVQHGPRCYAVSPSSYFLAKIDRHYTLVVFSQLKRKPSDSAVLAFFAQALPLLRTTEVIGKSLLPRVH